MNEFVPLMLPPDCVPEGIGICAECAAHSLFHRPTRTAVAFCEHTGTGAFYPLDGEWVVVDDVEDLATFREAFVRAAEAVTAAFASLH
ncbi:MAG: hypothetical protein WBM09_12120 [Gallionella sp.]